MRVKLVATLVALFICVDRGFAQQVDSYEGCLKHLRAKQRLRVSPEVIQGNAMRIILPKASDLTSIENADVEVRIVINDQGAVVCAAGASGEPDLVQRSVAAARQWKFMPYELKRKPITVETSILFHFDKGKVRVRFQPGV